MEKEKNDEFIIVLVEDNFIIRFCLKKILLAVSFLLRIKTKVFTSENGVEGLGYIYISKPSLSIIDLSLPDYSGAELIESLNHIDENSTDNLGVKTLVLTDKNTSSFKIKETLVSFDKSSKQFLENFLKFLFVNLSYYKSTHKEKDENIVIRLDKLSFWNKFYFKLLTNLAAFTIYYSTSAERLGFKIKETPSVFLKIIFSILWFVCQILLAIPFTLFHILTGSDKEENIVQQRKDLSQYRFHYFSTLTAFYSTIGITVLQVLLFIIGGITILGFRANSVFSSGDKTKVLDFKKSIYDVNLINTDGEKFNLIPQEFKADSSTNLKKYSQESPQILFNEVIDFDVLRKIDVNYSLNPADSDITLNQVKVQLSPDGEKWYYYSADSKKWEFTIHGANSSNSLDIANQNLVSFGDLVGTNKAFVKLFLQSDGFTNITIDEVKVSYELNALNVQNRVEISDVETQNPEFDPNFVAVLPSPKNLSVSFFDGKKIVTGRIPANIPLRDVGKYKVKVYYSKSSSEAIEGDLIGEAVLRINSRNEPTYKLVVPNRPGGYIITKLIYTNQQGEEKLSKFSKPMRSGTLSVDSTSDLEDAKLDGICEDNNGYCSLRAAIQEANNIPGEDKIEFNIPFSDEGYRDYDNPTSSRSGDESGGDDYWTINLQKELPQIVSQLYINGASQSESNGDSNTDGPDIEVTTNKAEISKAFEVNFIKTGNVSIDTLTINGFKDTAISIKNSSNILIDKVFICSDIKGNLKQNRSNKGISTIDSSEIYLTNSLINGCNADGVTIDKSSSVYIRGNYFGISQNGLSNIRSARGLNVASGSRNIDIGGLNDNDRNIFSANFTEAIILDSVENINIINNFCGVGRGGIVGINNLTITCLKANNIANSSFRNNIFSNSLKGVEINNSQNISIISNTFGSDVSKSRKYGNQVTALELISSNNNVNVSNNYFYSNTLAIRYSGSDKNFNNNTFLENTDNIIKLNS